MNTLGRPGESIGISLSMPCERRTYKGDEHFAFVLEVPVWLPYLSRYAGRLGIGNINSGCVFRKMDHRSFLCVLLTKNARSLLAPLKNAVLATA